MTGEENLQLVQDWCDEVWAKKRPLPFDCPYCGTHVGTKDEVCCETLEKAVNAIIERQQVADQITFAQRIQDRVQNFMGRYCHRN